MIRFRPEEVPSPRRRGSAGRVPGRGGAPLRPSHGPGGLYAHRPAHVCPAASALLAHPRHAEHRRKATPDTLQLEETYLRHREQPRVRLVPTEV